MIAILEFFSGIGDAIVAVFDFIVGFFRDFMQFLQLLVNLPEILANLINWIPSVYVPGFLLIFSVVILYKILGREG